MTYIVKLTDIQTGETTQSPRRFPSREAAEAWARKMVLHLAWKVEPEMPVDD